MSNQKAAFTCVLFHALYREKDARVPKHPLLFISNREFRECLELMLDKGIRFLDVARLRPPSAQSSLLPEEAHVLLTFDDGYYNNMLALDALEEYRVPAIFYLCKEPLEWQELFWWDVYYLSRAGHAPFETVYAEIQELKKLSEAARREVILSKCSADCFRPGDEVSRPFTVAEATQFAKNHRVRISVHSANHAVLDRCPPEVVAQELTTCKASCESIANEPVVHLSYPHGNFNREVLDDDDTAWLKLRRYVFHDPSSRSSVLEQVRQLAENLSRQISGADKRG